MNTNETVKKQIQDLLNDRARVFAEIDNSKRELVNKIAEAEKAMNLAMDGMNVEAYEQAKAEIGKLRLAVEMYDRKANQQAKMEFMSEAESDRIIDSLLDYEKELRGNFEEEAKKHLGIISDLLKEYLREYNDVEQTIKAWTANIHANYRSLSGGRYDEKGNWTNRMEKPVAVHPVVNIGKFATEMEGFFRASPEWPEWER